jgi:hypothetical protein
MKESITKFDLEAAFKALDEIDIPQNKEGIKANRPALTEIFSNKTKLDTLIEEYYDVGNAEDLTNAKEAREAEVAKAKLARIEKIVDLDAESPEDLLTSYVGKLIMQCPQCMTLFYKNQEDVVEDEADPTTVNVGEVCQHCGNETGYTLVGKVGEVTSEEAKNYQAEDETEIDVQGTTEDEESNSELSDEDFDLEGDEIDLEDLDLDLDIEDDEAEQEKEESFNHNDGQLLAEELTEAKAETSDFEALLDSDEFQKPISDQAVRSMMQEFNEDINSLSFLNVKGFDNKVLSTFEEGDIKGYTVRYSKDKKDIADIEFWGYTEPVSVAANLYAPNLLNRVYDSFEDFSKALTDKISELEEFQGKEELEDATEPLEEGIFDTVKNKVKEKVAKTFDKAADVLKTREAMADWILANAAADKSSLALDDKGNVIVDEDNRKFTKFLIIGFANKYKNGKIITIPPSPNNKNLVVEVEQPKVCYTYKDAENIAKGWSMRQGNGPAFIYMAKNKNDEDAVFLCEFFKGNLENDQLKAYFEIVKKDLIGAKLEAENENSQN